MFETIRDRLKINDEVNLEELKVLNAYRSVFHTPEGKQVLAHLLTDLGLFNELEPSEYEVAQHNAGIKILQRLGIIRAENIQSIIDALMNLPVKLT